MGGIVSMSGVGKDRGHSRGDRRLQLRVVHGDRRGGGIDGGRVAVRDRVLQLRRQVLHLREVRIERGYRRSRLAGVLGNRCVQGINFCLGSHLKLLLLGRLGTDKIDEIIELALDSSPRQHPHSTSYRSPGSSCSPGTGSQNVSQFTKLSSNRNSK